MEPELRQRKNITASADDKAEPESNTNTTVEQTKNDDQSFVKYIKNTFGTSNKAVDGTNSYWLTRIVYLRAISSIYFIAFLVAFDQNRALIGARGLTPANDYMQRVKEHFKDDRLSMYSYAPTILWFVNWQNDINFYLDAMSMAGMLIAATVIIKGSSNMILMSLLWVLYHSIVAVGQRWYGFGWESQTLETGFIAIWFVPFWSCSRWKVRPGSFPVMASLWMIFRIMLGAGLIKMRGDECWRDLTCMNYHYETQPMPNPIAYFLHKSPEFIHKFEIVGNHIVELVLPFLLFTPWRTGRLASGCGIMGFMGIIIISGNLSFLNHLTMIPAICALDDKFLSSLFPKAEVQKALTAQKTIAMSTVRTLLHGVMYCVIIKLSIPVAANLLSTRQVMNTSFDPLRIVNTYGAFGSITKERTELIYMASAVDHPSRDEDWFEIEFKCKPGSVSRRPCLISPYHYRLDWLMWFAAFQSPQQNPWLFSLAKKFLEQDKLTIDLVETPLLGTKRFKWIKIDHFEYKFGSKTSDWWSRRKLREFVRPVNLKMLKEYGV